MNGLLCYCRAGFEPELAGELTERAAEAGFAGYARTERDSGLVAFACEDAEALSRALPWSSLIFARQKLRLIAELRELDPKDRIAPMLDALQGRTRFGELVMEHPDSDAAKPLVGLARSLGNALRPALRKAGFVKSTRGQSGGTGADDHGVVLGLRGLGRQPQELGDAPELGPNDGLAVDDPDRRKILVGRERASPLVGCVRPIGGQPTLIWL